MTLNEWMKVNKSTDVRRLLAEKIGTTLNYLSQLAHSKSTKRKVSAEQCRALYFASKELTPFSIIYPSHERPDIAETFSIPVPENEREAA